MTHGVVRRTGWDGNRLRIELEDDAGNIHDLPWREDATFHWQVGDMVRPPDTPRYVFEPRALDAIVHDLDRATNEEARRMLESERRLCDRPHVVYIAFYSTLPKVGMTSADRLEARLREQGADAGMVVATLPDRAAARDLENSITFRYRLPQWRTHKEVLPQWTRSVDMDRIRSRADDLRRRLGPDQELGPLIPINDHPLPRLSARPHRVAPAGIHAGTVVGAKGTYLVYQAAHKEERLSVGHAPLAALKHTELVGRVVDTAGQ